jgi:hypothetical protein
MSRPAGTLGARTVRTRMLIATVAPLVVAVVLAGWLLWVRAEPERSGGFCANAAGEFASVLVASSEGVRGGVGLAPDVPAILAAARSIDVARFQVDTPPEIGDDVALLASDLRAGPGSGVGDAAAPEVQAALARVLAYFFERCR